MVSAEGDVPEQSAPPAGVEAHRSRDDRAAAVAAVLDGTWNAGADEIGGAQVVGTDGVEVADIEVRKNSHSTLEAVAGGLRSLWVTVVLHSFLVTVACHSIQAEEGHGSCDRGHSAGEVAAGEPYLRAVEAADGSVVQVVP